MATGTNNISQAQNFQVESVQVTSTTGTAAAGAVTVTGNSAKITTEALTTAQNATYTLTITDTSITATDYIFTSIANGTNTQGTPMIVRATPAAGSLVILVKNMHDAAQALNGTLVIAFTANKA